MTEMMLDDRPTAAAPSLAGERRLGITLVGALIVLECGWLGGIAYLLYRLFA